MIVEDDILPNTENNSEFNQIYQNNLNYLLDKTEKLKTFIDEATSKFQNLKSSIEELKIDFIQILEQNKVEQQKLMNIIIEYESPDYFRLLQKYDDELNKIKNELINFRKMFNLKFNASIDNAKQLLNTIHESFCEQFIQELRPEVRIRPKIEYQAEINLQNINQFKEGIYKFPKENSSKLCVITLNFIRTVDCNYNNNLFRLNILDHFEYFFANTDSNSRVMRIGGKIKYCKTLIEWLMSILENNMSSIRIYLYYSIDDVINHVGTKSVFLSDGELIGKIFLDYKNRQPQRMPNNSNNI